MHSQTDTRADRIRAHARFRDAIFLSLLSSFLRLNRESARARLKSVLTKRYPCGILQPWYEDVSDVFMPPRWSPRVNAKEHSGRRNNASAAFSARFDKLLRYLGRIRARKAESGEARQEWNKAQRTNVEAETRPCEKRLAQLVRRLCVHHWLSWRNNNSIRRLIIVQRAPCFESIPAIQSFRSDRAATATTRRDGRRFASQCERIKASD